VVQGSLPNKEILALQIKIAERIGEKTGMLVTVGDNAGTIFWIQSTLPNKEMHTSSNKIKSNKTAEKSGKK